MINRVTVTGSIISVADNGNNIGKMTVACKSIHRSSGGLRAKDDYLIFKYGSWIQTEDICRNFSRGDHVSCVGEVYSYVIRQKDGSPKEMIGLRLISIEHAKNEFSRLCGIDDGHYPQDCQAVCLEGIVVSVNQYAERQVMRLDLSEERHNVIDLTVSSKSARDAANIRSGEQVCVCTYVTTAQPGDMSRDYYDFVTTAIKPRKREVI